jgi:predicted ATPase/DNA-binding SARP family transcriptional activator
MEGSAVRVQLLGHFGIAVGKRDVSEGAWRLRKAKSVVKALALAPEHRLHRDRVCELLWPDRDSASAANNLHQALYVARRALDSAGPLASDWLQFSDDSLVLGEPAPWIDVEAYEAAATAAREAPSLEAYTRALDLYGGELLPEDRYEEWTLTRRDALREMHLGVLLEVAELHTAAGDRSAAIEALHQAVVHDPLDEEAHRRLIRLYAESGRRQQALAQYHQLRQALRREYEADPDPVTRQLYQEVLSGRFQSETALDAERGAPARRAASPAGRPSTPQSAALNNIPFQLTSFIGREREVEEVHTVLRRSRLVTLTGPGGCGKSRLALEVAVELLHGFQAGAWLVELAGLSSPTLVASQVASVLGVELRSERDPVEVLVRHLRERELLLVLDNCEHVVDAAAELASRLLSACPQLVVLATSREPLRIGGEVTWRVPSLGFPDPAVELGAAELERYAAIRLFCERAAAATPDFALTDANAAAIAEICFRLDGMPLALELAAARSRVLAPAQMVERLGDALGLLGGGQRGALTRQQTLEATLRWSHDLLDDEERVLFRRLAVFAGTFALQAAETVCVGDGVEPHGVVALLERLVDKSLVVTEETDLGYRYRLLDTIRQYAQQRLSEAAEEPATEARHRAWCLDFAAANDPHELGGPTTVPVERIDPEHDNMRAALASALVHDPDAALRLAAHLWPFWMARGYFIEGFRWIEQTLAHSSEPTATRAAALQGSCGLATRRGKPERVLPYGAEVVEIQRRLGDPQALGAALEQLATWQWGVGDVDLADRTLDEADELARTAGLPEIKAAVGHSRALLAYSRASYALAREQLEQSIALFESVPAGLGPVYWASTPGLFVVDDLGNGRPRMFAEETLLLFRRVNSDLAVPYLRFNLAQAARSAGELDVARDSLDLALAEFRDLKDDAGAALALCGLGNLARTGGDFDLAREALEEGRDLRVRLGDDRGIRIALGGLGLLAGRAGDMSRARELLGRGRELSERSEDEAAAGALLLNLGNLELDAGEPERAVSVLSEAERRLEQQLIARCLGWVRAALAEALAASGDADGAAAWRERARQSFERVGDVGGLDLLATQEEEMPA